MDQNVIAKKFVKDLKAILKKYRKHKHLREFLLTLEGVYETVKCVIEDTEDVE